MFEKYDKLHNIEFSYNSKLRLIEYGAFFQSSIEKVIFPSTVTKICENAFSCCRNLRKVEFKLDSAIEIIDESAFAYSSIENISFSSKS